MAAMETLVQPEEDKLDLKKEVKKRVHSGKRFSYGKTVQFPDWRISNDHHRTTQLIVSYQEGKKISKLREPRNLYAVASNYKNCSISIPRWPSEMKVLSERPQHLDNLPQEPEKFYTSGEVPDNLPVLTKPEDGTLVYENTFGNSKYFDCSHSGGNAVKKSSINLSDTLWFESRFESGNLSKAIKVGPCDYQLWLRTDLYTEKYTQWYYFRVENTQPGEVYRFTIMNLMKSNSLYNCGMKPLMYSEHDAREKGVGWRRVGTNIKYYKNELKREDARGEHPLYSLSWTVMFPHTRDRCYFAHCYPYTYTDLQEYLSKLSKDPSRARYCKQRTLARTLAGNLVYLMTITSPSKCPAEAKRKRAVVLTARVHPGETNSSWMMKGLLDYITSDTLDAKLLRDTFVFKVVPMLNPDGVIVGNYRCSLSGRDLNRNYKTTLKEAFPSVWHTREMIKRLRQEREITLYCDFHGHSRQQNVFIYGCEDRTNLEHGFKERVFPMMMSKNCKDKFCFKRCKFKVQNSKSGTGRVVMWNLGISNSYTMEATFCGSTLGSRAGEHFTTADFESMGYHLCDTLLDYCDPDTTKYFSILNEVEVYVKSLVLERMKERGVAGPDMKPSDVDLNRDYMTESSTSGSDSSVSDGLPMQVIYSAKEEITKKKKKRLKTRKERNKHRNLNWSKPVKAREPEENQVTSAENNRANVAPKGGKNSKASSRQRQARTRLSPSPQKVCKTPPTPEQNDSKVLYLQSRTEDNSPNRLPSRDGQSIPQLRYTGKLESFGLAPATPARSLNRWSAPQHDITDENDEEENSFIGRYLARQIRLSIHRKSDSNKDSMRSPPKHDNAELVRKLQRYNASCKMLATAQAGDWKGRVDEVRTRVDNKDSKGHSWKYCAHHAAMLEKNKKEETVLEGNKLYASIPKISSCHENIRGSNTQQENFNSKHGTQEMSTETVTRDERETLLEKRSYSDSSFPIVSVEGAQCIQRQSEKRLFNFRGVPQKITKSGYSLSRDHRNSFPTDDDYFSQDLSQVASQPKSQGFIGPHVQSSYEKNCSNEKSITGSNKDNSSEQNIHKETQELAKKAVGRLRKKLQNLNSPGSMVNFALKNQLDDVEEDIKKSLLDEYRFFQSKRRGGCQKSISKNKSKNSTQKTSEKNF